MKLFKLLTVALVIIASFNVTQAKAGILDWLFPPHKPQPTHLPINGGIVFLMIAGLVIGITLIMKSRPAKVEVVRIK